MRNLFENLQRDWQWSVHAYWNPCWKGQARRGDRADAPVRSMREHLAVGAPLGRGRRRAAPPMAPVAAGPPHLRQLHLLHHPDSTFCGGMRGLERELHAARPSLLSRGCRTTVAMMVREPWSFHRSWYVYIGARRCDRCLFPAYVELNPNAQSHLVLGYRPRVYDAELRRRHVQRDPALARELDEQLRAVDLVAPMERIGEFLLLLCDLAGLRECPHVGRHNHHTSFSDRNEFKIIARKHNVTIAEVAPSPSHPAHAAAVANYSWLDDVLYARAIAAFEISVADAQRRWPGGAAGSVTPSRAAPTRPKTRRRTASRSATLANRRRRRAASRCRRPAAAGAHEGGDHRPRRPDEDGPRGPPSRASDADGARGGNRPRRCRLADPRAAADGERASTSRRRRAALARRAAAVPHAD